MNDVINKFLLDYKSIPKIYKKQNLHIVHMDHLLLTKNKYKNLKKQQILQSWP